MGRMPAGWLLLHRDAALHWFMLVPETNALDLLDLPESQCAALMRDATRVADFLKQQLGYPRVNVGALGLVVPQLHLHVIGRRESDPCWPAPVWGRLASTTVYSDQQIQQLRNDLDELMP